MIFNLEPLDAGLPASPAPPSEPFHPKCRIISAERIQRRVQRLLHAGEAMAAMRIAEAANLVSPGLFIITPHSDSD